MKKAILVLLILMTFSISSFADDIYVVLKGSIKVIYYDKNNYKKIKTLNYISPVIKMDSERYADEYAKQSFTEALNKKQRDNQGVEGVEAMTFNDRKDAYNHYKDLQKKMYGVYKMSFTKTAIEKLWREEMKKKTKK